MSDQQAAEVVAHYDAAGHVLGRVPRGRAYREGLWHAGTGVLVTSPDGQRLVLHRRTPDKLIFPGRYDCWAGGVVGAGEQPQAAARRELAEELGITGVELVALGVHRFEHHEPPTAGRPGASVRYHGFLYRTRWAGPLRPQATEIDWAGWVTLDRLAAVLGDPTGYPFVPDGRRAAELWLGGRLA